MFCGNRRLAPPPLLLLSFFLPSLQPKCQAPTELQGRDLGGGAAGRAGAREGQAARLVPQSNSLRPSVGSSICDASTAAWAPEPVQQYQDFSGHRAAAERFERLTCSVRSIGFAASAATETDELPPLK